MKRSHLFRQHLRFQYIATIDQIGQEVCVTKLQHQAFVMVKEAASHQHPILSILPLQRRPSTTCWRWLWRRWPFCPLAISSTSGGGTCSVERPPRTTTTPTGGIYGKGARSHALCLNTQTKNLTLTAKSSLTNIRLHRKCFPWSMPVTAWVNLILATFVQVRIIVLLAIVNTLYLFT